jgi:hypothetical protein
MKVTVFIGEVVWEQGEGAAPSPERLGQMVTSMLEQQFARGNAEPRVPQGRSRLSGLALDADRPIDSANALGQSIATAVQRSLDQGNW